MTNPNFFNVNINVDGKNYTVKVEDGIALGNFYEGKTHYFKDNTIFQGDGTNYGEINWKIYNNNRIEMNESEYALFKNIADNCNEGGDVLTLSKQDFDKAIELYEEGKFTNDIQKNLPNEDSTEAWRQYRSNNYYIGARSEKGTLDLIIPERTDSNEMELVKEKLNNKICDEAVLYYSGDGFQGFTYVDKDGWECDAYGNKIRKITNDK